MEYQTYPPPYEEKLRKKLDYPSSYLGIVGLSVPFPRRSLGSGWIILEDVIGSGVTCSVMGSGGVLPPDSATLVHANAELNILSSETVIT